MSAQLTAEAALADPSVVSAAELVDFLTADRAHGLAASEADRRLARDGLNELRSAPPLPAWRRILAQFADPLVYLLLVAIAVSTLAWSIEGGHGLPVDALVIALIALANAILGYSLDSARTAGFTVLVFAQLFNCFNARCARAHAGTCSPTAGSGPTCVAMGSTVLWSSELRKLSWRLPAPETGTSQATGVGPAPDSALPQGRR